MISLFAWNLLIITPLSFLTCALLVEGLLFVLRIQRPRLRTYIRLLPLFKLLLDLFLYDYVDWAPRLGINPIEAQEGTRLLQVSAGYPITPGALFQSFLGIRFILSSGETFSLADMIAMQLPKWLLDGCVCLFLVSTVLIWSKGVKIYLREKRKWEDRINYAKPFDENQLPCRWDSQAIAVYHSPYADVPMAMGGKRPCILLPTHLLKALSSTEIQAVLSHEAAHVHWKDSRMTLFIYLLQYLFWWVPMKWWTCRLFFDLERACDRACCEPIELAAALSKTARFQSNFHSPQGNSFFGAKKSTYRRIDALLKGRHRKNRLWIVFVQTLLALCCFWVLLGSRLWIF